MIFKSWEVERTDIFRENIKKHKSVLWCFLLGFITFFGFAAFPFSNERSPLDFQKALMLFVGYGYLGLCFAVLLKKGKSHWVLLLSFVFTAIGMGLRYALEYGEVSNTINFIPINIALFIIIIPIYCMTVYWGIYRWFN